MNEETLLFGFKTVCNFVADLNSAFGKKHKPLRLYNRLASHTQISHDQAIRKHIAIFSTFCVANREAILTQDVTKIAQKKLEYSERVFIDMGLIFSMADEATLPAIWQHLLAISAIVDPLSRAKEVLKKNATPDSGPEQAFVANLMSKIESTVQPDANPMQAVSSIMQSGLMGELLGGLQSGNGTGSLDVKKLFGVVQNLMSDLSVQAGDNPEAKQTVGMLNNMIGSMANAPAGSPPDMSGMMQMVTSLMGNMTGDTR